MKNVLRFAVLAICMSFSARAALAQATPEALLTKLYKEHIAGSGPWLAKAPSLKYFEEYFEPVLAKKLYTARTAEEPVLDADPLLDAQDDDVKKATVKRVSATATTANMSVSFVNYGKVSVLRFSLKKVTAGWRVNNITYQSGYTLLGLLKG